MNFSWKFHILTFFREIKEFRIFTEIINGHSLINIFIKIWINAVFIVSLKQIKMSFHKITGLYLKLFMAKSLIFKVQESLFEIVQLLR